MKKIFLSIIIIIVLSLGIFALLIYDYNKDISKEESEYKETLEKSMGDQSTLEREFYEEQRRREEQIKQEQIGLQNKDEDGDGLTYIEELRLGTSDNEIDSDGDDIIDPEDPHPAGGGENYKITVHWTHEGFPYTTQFGIHEDKYLYYKNQKRSYCCSDWSKYATPNDPTIQTIAKDIVDVSISTGDTCRLCIAIDFVQSMIYEYDIDYIGVNEYPKYAIETIIDEKGDCEDTSFLMASILEALGVDTILFNLPGHIAVGVYCETCSGSYYLYNGRKYYFLETTGAPGSWQIGRTSYDLNTELEEVIDV